MSDLGRRNFDLVMRKVDSIDYQEGLRAYENYQRTLSRLAEFYSTDLSVAAGVFCALSPNNDYMGNLRSAATVLKAAREGIPESRVVTSTFYGARHRAWRVAVLREDFLSFTKGPKTRSFYQNILNPLDPSPVTVDGHIVSAWKGVRLTMVQAVRSGFRYQEVADDVRAIAHEYSLIPSQAQAMIWFTWKRLNRVIYQPQMDLFKEGDHWGQDLQPEDIRPFPFKKE